MAKTPEDEAAEQRKNIEKENDRRLGPVKGGGESSKPTGPGKDKGK